MANKNTNYPWQDKVCNHTQVGGIETSIMDNGLGKGNRIAWINTGTGLRYKVVFDRAMDIADAFFNQHSLTWISHAGITAPRPDANRGFEWLWSFGGGLLATCGLTQIGAPNVDGDTERGLHGRIGNFPASIESIIQPDLPAGKLDMSITGVVKQSAVLGPNLEMRRTISSTIGEPTIRINDVVTNRGSMPVPHMFLYHCNFGWPLINAGTDIVMKGKRGFVGIDTENAIFNGKHNFRKCPGPLKAHKTGGHAWAVIDVAADTKGICTIGIANQKLGIAVAMKYKKSQLPCLTNWQYWGSSEYVTSLEPGTNGPIGQDMAREQKELKYIAPGKSRKYEIQLSILTDKTQIGKFIKSAGTRK